MSKYVVILILPYGIKITTNYKISYFGFNIDRKSTYEFKFSPRDTFKISQFRDVMLTAGPQQVGTDGQKNFLFINLRCKGNKKSSIGM